MCLLHLHHTVQFVVHALHLFASHIPHNICLHLLRFASFIVLHFVVKKRPTVQVLAVGSAKTINCISCALFCQYLSHSSQCSLYSNSYSLFYSLVHPHSFSLYLTWYCAQRHLEGSELGFLVISIQLLFIWPQDWISGAQEMLR